MEGNKKILVIAVLLLLIAASYGTYAIYKSSVSGQANVSVAKWAVEFKNGQTPITDTFELTFTAADCTGNTHVASGKFAPGVSCSKQILIDATGTEVDVSYVVSVDDTNIKVNGVAMPANSNEITASAGTSDGQIMMSDNPQTDTVTVTVAWGGQEGSTYDPGDTSVGETASAVITVPVTITAKQMVG